MDGKQEIFLCLTQYISDAIVNSKVELLYSKLSKAFEKLEHIILTSKFKSFIFSNHLIKSEAIFDIEYFLLIVIVLRLKVLL